MDLGFAETCEPWVVESRLFPSKIGGKPAWLSLEHLPSVEELTCEKCGKTMIFLCQVYAPFDDANNFHRTVFVFVCKTASCCERNDSTNVKVFRSSLKRENKFYPYDPPDDGPDETFRLSKWVQLCNVCGNLANKHCSQCKTAAYCGRDHQILDWREGHKTECNKLVKSERKSSLLFPEFELILESEDVPENQTSEEKEMEEFKKLEAEGKTGTLNDVSESDLDAHATSETDKTFTKFKEAVESNPQQVLRYHQKGEPLWIASAPIPEEIPNCEHCGERREFEFQIMPQMLAILKENDIDWGVIAVYTCSSKSCAGDSYIKEYLFKQDVSLSSI